MIETWKDAGIPLEAVLRGIDAAFDRYEKRPSKSRKVNSLAYCAQEVLAAAEDMKEAAVGVAKDESKPDRGFQAAEIAAFLRKNAGQLGSREIARGERSFGSTIARETAKTCRSWRRRWRRMLRRGWKIWSGGLR